MLCKKQEKEVFKVKKLANILALIGILGSIVIIAGRLLFGPGVLPLIGVANSTALMFSNSMILIGLGLNQVVKK